MEFINGITLLNAIPVTDHSHIISTIFWMIIGMAIITLIMFWIFFEIDLNTMKDTEVEANIFGGAFCVTLVCALIMAIIWSCSEVPTGEYRYQVTIDEDTNFVEFYEKYDLIEQEGKIYTIELKEGETK